MKKQYSILLVEDEENFGSVLKNYLELSDYIVTLCTDGNKGLTSFNNNIYDLCILDVMMPARDGFSLATEIKKINPSIPLIFLTAKKLKEDILKGYQIGADDYITKPFDTEVLLYKLKAILNRNGNAVQKEEQLIYTFGLFSFNTEIRELKSKTTTKKLSPKESELLKLLCENLNGVVSRDLALNKIWKDNNYFTTRSMDVFIAKLRKYLKEDSAIEIINVHGNGFRLLVK
ncbi:MAG: response regulator transcription factor [Gammaproteobacteria bacterium]|nr:response regulator transcription factor [Gammaproteobacteria bacterium]